MTATTSQKLLEEITKAGEARITLAFKHTAKNFQPDDIVATGFLRDAFVKGHIVVNLGNKDNVVKALITPQAVRANEAFKAFEAQMAEQGIEILNILEAKDPTELHLTFRVIDSPAPQA